LPSSALKEECGKIVAALEGVKKVDNELIVSQYYDIAFEEESPEIRSFDRLRTNG